MSLPLLNDTPKYELKIPSTGKKIKYRPYLVKEEKILLIANESKDPKLITDSIVDTIQACTDNKIKISELTTFDLEYLFIKIRAKSVGENVDMTMPCSECKQRNEVSINLDEVECPVENVENIIVIDKDISVEMQYPSYDKIENSEDETEAVFNIIATCIKAVYSKDERIDIEDEPKETVVAFLDSMTRTQFQKISDFIQTMPQVQHSIIFDCSSCDEHNEIEIKGLQNFF